MSANELMVLMVRAAIEGQIRILKVIDTADARHIVLFMYFFGSSQNDNFSLIFVFAVLQPLGAQLVPESVVPADGGNWFEGKIDSRLSFLV